MFKVEVTTGIMRFSMFGMILIRLHWGTLCSAAENGGLKMDISGNFWGGASDSLVEIAITDFS